MLIAAFSADTLAWAAPASESFRPTTTLAVQSIFRPIADEGIAVTAELRGEIFLGADFLTKGKTPTLVNAYIDEMYSRGAPHRRRLIDFTDVERTGTSLRARFVVLEAPAISFEIEYRMRMDGTAFAGGETDDNDHSAGLLLLQTFIDRDVFETADHIEIRKVDATVSLARQPDRRPVQAGLLDAAFVEHDQAVRNVINPHNAPHVAVYGGAGADVSNFLLSTNAASAYFVASYSGLSVIDLKQLKEYGGKVDSDYGEWKYTHGFAHGGDLSTKSKILAALAFELESMGVDLATVRADLDGDCPRILFAWAYNGSQVLERSITFIDADMTRPSRYPAKLVRVLREGIDVYYQRAGHDMPRSYTHKDNFIAALHAALRPGGFLVTDDYAVNGDPTTGIDDCGKDFPVRLSEVALPDRERIEEAIIRVTAPDRMISESEFLRFGNRHIENPRMRYGWQVRIRQKPPLPLRSSTTAPHEAAAAVALLASIARNFARTRTAMGSTAAKALIYLLETKRIAYASNKAWIDQTIEGCLTEQSYDAAIGIVAALMKAGDLTPAQAGSWSGDLLLRETDPRKRCLAVAGLINTSIVSDERDGRLVRQVFVDALREGEWIAASALLVARFKAGALTQAQAARRSRALLRRCADRPTIASAIMLELISAGIVTYPKNRRLIEKIVASSLEAKDGSRAADIIMRLVRHGYLAPHVAGLRLKKIVDDGVFEGDYEKAFLFLKLIECGLVSYEEARDRIDAGIRTSLRHGHAFAVSSLVTGLIASHVIDYRHEREAINNAIASCVRINCPSSAAEIVQALVDEGAIGPGNDDEMVIEAVLQLLDGGDTGRATDLLLAFCRSIDRAEAPDPGRYAHARRLLEKCVDVITGTNPESRAQAAAERTAAILSLGGCDLEGVRSRSDAVSVLAAWQRPAGREYIYNTCLKPLFAVDPASFDGGVVGALAAGFGTSIPMSRYALYYATMGERSPPPYPADLFPHQETFRRIMLDGDRSRTVLISHNSDDGQGDELIRNDALMEALLAANPRLKIVLYTNRPYLFNHPRVELRSLDGPVPTRGERFDMVVRHFNALQPCNYAFEERLSGYLAAARVTAPGRVYLETASRPVGFSYGRAIVDGNDIDLPDFNLNVYEYTAQLCAELGLPFRYGGAPSREPLLTGFEPDEWAAHYWRETVSVANSEGRPIVVFNGFGGADEDKGYGRTAADRKRVRKALSALVSRGAFVIVLPNHQEWGSEAVATEIVQSLPRAARRHLLVAPAPVDDDSPFSSDKDRYRRLPKYLVAWADRTVTTEGGLVHLAYALGRPFTAFRFKGSGRFPTWLPFLAGPDQNGVEEGELLSEIARPGWLPPCHRPAPGEPTCETAQEDAGWEWDAVLFSQVDKDFADWVRMGGMASEDLDLLKAILTGDERILENLLITYPDKVAIKADDRGDSEKDGRTVYLTLDNPFPAPGGDIEVLRIKGARPRGGIDDPAALQSHTGSGFDYHPIVINSRGNPAVRHLPMLPDYTYDPSVLTPQGAMLAERASREYAVMQAGSAGRGFETDYPVACGVWKGRAHAERPVGFIIAGMRSDDMRIDIKTLIDRATLLRNVVTGRVRGVDDAMATEIYRQIGRSLRAYHDAGYFHQYPHYANWGVEVGSDGTVRVVMRDLDTTLVRREMRGRSPRRQEAAHRLIDLQRIVADLSSDGTADFVGVGGFAKNQVLTRTLPFVRSLLEGYFPEISSNLVVFEQLLAKATSADFAYMRRQLRNDDEKIVLSEDEPVVGVIWKRLYDLAIARQKDERAKRNGPPAGSAASVFDFMVRNDRPLTVGAIAEGLGVEPATLEPDMRALMRHFRLARNDTSSEGDEPAYLLTDVARLNADAILPILEEMNRVCGYRPTVEELTRYVDSIADALRESVSLSMPPLDSARRALMIRSRVYSAEELDRVGALYVRFAAGADVADFSPHDLVAIWQYMVLSKIGLEEEWGRSFGKRPLLLRIEEELNRIGPRFEVDGLFRGYDWDDHLPAHDKKETIRKNLAIKPGIKLLDIGCGKGNVVIDLARENPDARFVGIDANPYNIGAAIDRLLAMGDGAPKNLRLYMRDCRAPIMGRDIPRRGVPFHDDTFDIVTVLEGVMDEESFKEAWQRELWQEAIRVARKDGGHIVFFGLVGSAALPQSLLQGVLATRMPDTRFSINGKLERYFLQAWTKDEELSPYRRDRCELYIWQLERDVLPVVPAPVAQPTPEPASDPMAAREEIGEQTDLFDWLAAHDGSDEGGAIAARNPERGGPGENALSQDEMADDENVSCGTICQWGHQERLDPQFAAFYERLAREAGLTKDLLTGDDVIEALDRTGRLRALGVTKERLMAMREEIREDLWLGEQTDILFALPDLDDPGQKLWYIRNPDWGRKKRHEPEWLYAAGHCNREGTRIHISLPLVLAEELTGSSPEDAAMAIAWHEREHIRAARRGMPRDVYHGDRGMQIAEAVYTVERRPKAAPPADGKERLRAKRATIPLYRSLRVMRADLARLSTEALAAFKLWYRGTIDNAQLQEAWAPILSEAHKVITDMDAAEREIALLDGDVSGYYGIDQDGLPKHRAAFRLFGFVGRVLDGAGIDTSLYSSEERFIEVQMPPEGGVFVDEPGEILKAMYPGKRGFYGEEVAAIKEIHCYHNVKRDGQWIAIDTGLGVFDASYAGSVSIEPDSVHRERVRQTVAAWASPVACAGRLAERDHALARFSADRQAALDALRTMSMPADEGAAKGEEGTKAAHDALIGKIRTACASVQPLFDHLFNGSFGDEYPPETDCVLKAYIVSHVLSRRLSLAMDGTSPDRIEMETGMKINDKLETGPHTWVVVYREGAKAVFIDPSIYGQMYVDRYDGSAERLGYFMPDEGLDYFIEAELGIRGGSEEKMRERVARVRTQAGIIPENNGVIFFARYSVPFDRMARFRTCTIDSDEFPRSRDRDRTAELDEIIAKIVGAFPEEDQVAAPTPSMIADARHALPWPISPRRKQRLWHGHDSVYESAGVPLRHYGIDILTKEHAPVTPIAAGRVIAVKHCPWGGMMVYVRSGDLVHSYMHIDGDGGKGRIDLPQVGTMVDERTVIGTVVFCPRIISAFDRNQPDKVIAPFTGDDHANHLHLECWRVKPDLNDDDVMESLGDRINEAMTAGTVERIDPLDLLAPRREAPRQGVVAKSRAITVRQLERTCGIETGLMRDAAKVLQASPVNIPLGLSLIPRERDGLTPREAAGELDQNMETIARLVAYERQLGLDIRYDLSDESDGAFVAVAREALEKKLTLLGRSLGIDIDIATIFRPHAKGTPGLIEIPLKEIDEIRAMPEIADRVYPVALLRDRAGEGVSLPNYVAASAIGLTLAALRITSDKVVTHQAEKAVYDEQAARALADIEPIYKRYGVDTRELNGDALDVMVRFSGSARFNFILKFALPPVAKFLVDKLGDYHAAIQRALQSA